MNQTSWTAAFVAIGFFVYITVKGQLPQYQAAIFGGKDSTSSGAIPSNPASTQAIGTAGGFGMN